jgi:predicted metal-binding membrane protein
VTTASNAFRREKFLILAGVTALTLLAWYYTAHLMAGMAPMGDMHRPMAIPQMLTWDLTELSLLFLMWAVMMIAMMAPSALPMILSYHETAKGQAALSRSFMFLLGYLLAWAAYSVAVTLLQWRLHEAALLSPMMVAATDEFGALLLIAAGVFQWTPLKHMCLVRCRSPLGFLMMNWRDGKAGAAAMGLHHGLFCIGCCWLLMLLLFVAGMMNLLWVAAIAVFILAEKVAPKGDVIARCAGALFVLAGLAMLTQGH